MALVPRSIRCAEAAFSKIDAEFRKNESRVQSEGLRLSIEKMLVQCLVAATPVWPKAPSVDKLDSDALLESYRQLYSSRIRKMAQELSGPMTLFLHGSSEMETRKGQENLKFVSDKHTKEWEEVRNFSPQDPHQKSLAHFSLISALYSCF